MMMMMEVVEMMMMTITTVSCFFKAVVAVFPIQKSFFRRTQIPSCSKKRKENFYFCKFGKPNDLFPLRFPPLPTPNVNVYLYPANRISTNSMNWISEIAFACNRTGDENKFVPEVSETGVPDRFRSEAWDSNNHRCYLNKKINRVKKKNFFFFPIVTVGFVLRT